MAPFNQALPALVIPAIVGLFILWKFRRDRFARMAGWFTFKPVIATPPWVLLVMVAPILPLGILPGAIITVILATRFKDVIKKAGRTGKVLLILDSIRWINSGLILPYTMGSGLSLAVALIMPTAYALVALALVISPGVKASLMRSADWRAQPRTKWTMGLIWVLATCIACVVGSLASQQESLPLFAPLISGTIFGSVLGIGQWLVLRTYLRRSGWWIGATALGTASGTFILEAIFRGGIAGLSYGSIAAWLVQGLVAGISLGVAQWIVLRQYVRHSTGWIWANVIGWTIVIGASSVVSVQFAAGTASYLFTSVRGLIVGIVTAIALVRIMRSAPLPSPTEDQRSAESSVTMTPTQVVRPRVYSYFSMHKGILLLTLIIGGALVWLVAGVLPWANQAGYFEKWQRFAQVPVGAAEILKLYNGTVYVRTTDGAIYGCPYQRDNSFCGPAELPGEASSSMPTRMCNSSGPEFSLFSGQPPSMVSCVQEYNLHFPGGRSVYMLDGSGGLWYWYHGDSLLGGGLGFWVVALLLGLVAGGVIIWAKTTMNVTQPTVER